MNIQVRDRYQRVALHLGLNLVVIYLAAVAGLSFHEVINGRTPAAIHWAIVVWYLWPPVIFSAIAATAVSKLGPTLNPEVIIDE